MNDIDQVRQLTVPTHFPVGPVNLYALAGPDGFYLIDAGVANDEARKLIKEWLPLPLAGIILTHSHPDHLGLAGELAREHDCPIYLNFAEYNRLTNPDASYEMLLAQLLAQGGVPEEELLQLGQIRDRIRDGNVNQLTDVEVQDLNSGQTFSTDLGELAVIYTPGHSIGHCCFYLAEKGLLFSGDHILANISPNPVFVIGKDGQRRKSFVEYLDSLKLIESLSINVVYPGHGQPFQDLPKVMKRFHSYHARREQNVLAVLTNEPQTPFRIAQKLYPRMKDLDVLLAVSKVWGHLDLLEIEGKVRVSESGGRIYYQQ